MHNVQQMTDCILRVLEENPNKTWNQKVLSAAVCAELGADNLMRTVETIIRALVVSGRIQGRVRTSRDNNRTTAYDIRYQQQGSSSSSETEALQRLVRTLRERAEKAEKQVTTAEGYLRESAEVVQKYKAQAEEAQRQAEKAQKESRSIEVHLKDPQGNTKKVTEGVFHRVFSDVLQLATNRRNIFLYGPTGCGKNHLCEQLAEALDLRFGFVSCTSGMSEGQVSARLLPTVPNIPEIMEAYQDLTKQKVPATVAATIACSKSQGFSPILSEFADFYENGGVFLLDEIDGADPNVLLVINAALAGKRMALPNRPDKPYADRHPDFICVAAANTLGTGADRTYSGRNQLDAAFLDRFQIGKVLMDYDERIDATLCPDAELRERLQRYRAAIQANRLERALSSRFMQDAYLMRTEAEWTPERIDEALFQGWREDERNKVLQHRPAPSLSL
jgi:MoxR-like ATPase